MDAHRFDRLAVALAATPSRRRVLRLLAGSALGSLLGARARGEAAGQAGCGLVGAGCTVNDDCCRGARCNARNRCACRAGAGFSACPVAGGERCFRLQTDRDHCGACGNACADGELCCGGACVDPATDGEHCGGCDRFCPSAPCCEGACCPPHEVCTRDQAGRLGCCLFAGRACDPAADRCCRGANTGAAGCVAGAGGPICCRHVGHPCGGCSPDAPCAECCSGFCEAVFGSGYCGCPNGQRWDAAAGRCLCDGTDQPPCNGACCAAGECCSGGRCRALCNGVCCASDRVCCGGACKKPLGGACTTAGQCCSGACLVPRGVASGACCQPAGGACATDLQGRNKCCSGVCNRGACT